MFLFVVHLSHYLHLLYIIKLYTKMNMTGSSGIRAHLCHKHILSLKKLKKIQFFVCLFFVFLFYGLVGYNSVSQWLNFNNLSLP